jgi:hypothetical protein
MTNPNIAEFGKGTQFKPGESGNPGGKPLAARHALNAAFTKALAKDFQEKGEEAIKRAREEDPIGYVRVLAGMLPKEIEVKNSLDELNDEQLNSAIIAVRAILAAQGTPEGAVAEREPEQA